MSTHFPPFRADVVGSYLRPDYLHEARRQFAAGQLTQLQLTEVEDKAISELVARQKAAGLQVITDGEFRRSWWHLDFMWGLNGVEKSEIEQGYLFAQVETRPESVRLTGKISGENHPFLEHFKFLLQFAEEGIVPRLTVPAPAQFLKELQRPCNLEQTQAIYPDEAELLNDIVLAYQTFIQELYAVGCRNLQIDDCTWGMLTDPKIAAAAAEAATPGEVSCGCGDSHDFDHVQSIASLTEKLLQVNNRALENAPVDLVLTTHVCRGNYRSTWAASGGYAPIADVLFARENVSAFYLEFDTDRSGDFSPLAKVPQGKQVVLGLVSSKTGKLENTAEVIARIHEAAQYVPLENLCLSTQCGFASTEEGNELTDEQQWQKIAFVREVAQQVWG
ncbi:5-methyltetrahydropteroyltriglutamate--homocysteine S-methyltransferase [Vibrio mangrovi]|uniref:5-methyltetrahydropteroyltriglutamate--homocysteine S-methyltransferase n=1 Tax=Vibrio mangrovi TaxID=474394 RepID=A0A1Y6IZ02_9VIBR|nr:5-methyltetrahydropteroyltriglutamate--homocysteine S-methyltransferase [Vibrio mangrovi]MDW6002759.1 5-methyltetrahydropteroyltriglutamate--homocysteine S-methyltransferase [Vibrio mangrovi]SMS02251.1 5-methyltetrahydropteroyltriglutamate--homocysteine methyltransferase [Vibrio mangrovi]